MKAYGSLTIFSFFRNVAGNSMGIFTVSIWNGASYYVEVFGRRFEKELLALKRELEVMQTTESVVSAAEARGSGAAINNTVANGGCFICKHLVLVN